MASNANNNNSGGDPFGLDPLLETNRAVTTANNDVDQRDGKTASSSSTSGSQQQTVMPDDQQADVNIPLPPT